MKLTASLRVDVPHLFALFCGLTVLLIAPAGLSEGRPGGLTHVTEHQESIVLGGGCFWGAEKLYASLPGVIDARTGFAGGSPVDISQYPEDDYSDALIAANHAEVVEVSFNRQVLSLEEVLKVFFESHDPTQLNRQGEDVGPSYRSIILVNNQQQRITAEKTLKTFQKKMAQAGFGRIVTQIQTLEKFYLAEERHQDYLVKNPDGYCPDYRTGVRFDAVDEKVDATNKTISTGCPPSSEKVSALDEEPWLVSAVMQDSGHEYLEGEPGHLIVWGDVLRRNDEAIKVIYYSPDRTSLVVGDRWLSKG